MFKTFDLDLIEEVFLFYMSYKTDKSYHSCSQVCIHINGHVVSAIIITKSMIDGQSNDNQKVKPDSGIHYEAYLFPSLHKLVSMN